MRVPPPFVLGAVIGAAALPAAYLAAPMARGTGALGLDLTATATPSGEVAMTGGPLLLQRPAMQPGDRAVVERRVRNQAGRALTVRVRVLPDSRALDGTLLVRVAVDGRRVFDGPLGGLRAWSERWFLLRRDERRELAITVEVPRDAGARARGRMASLTFELQARPRPRA